MSQRMVMSMDPDINAEQTEADHDFGYNCSSCDRKFETGDVSVVSDDAGRAILCWDCAQTFNVRSKGLAIFLAPGDQGKFIRDLPQESQTRVNDTVKLLKSFGIEASSFVSMVNALALMRLAQMTGTKIEEEA